MKHNKNHKQYIDFGQKDPVILKKAGLIILFLMLAIFTISCSSFQYDPEAMKLKSDSDQLNKDGLALMDEGNYEEAVDLLEQALTSAKQFDDAKDSNSEVKQAGVLLSNSYNNLSNCYYQLGDYDQSLEYAEKAIELEPNDDYEYVNYGNVLSYFYRNEEALEYYDKAIDYNTSSLYAYYGKGCVYYETGEYEKALEMFREYLSYDSSDIDGILYLVNSYFSLGNYEKALENVEKAIERNETSYELYESKGEILEASTTYEETEAFYQDLTLKFPDQIEAKLLLGELYYDNSKYQEALDYYVALKNANPDSIEIDSLIISCYEALGATEQAVIYFQSIVSSGNATSELYNTIGDMHLNLYDNMEAIRYYDEAIHLFPEDIQSYINKMNALTNAKRYSQCLQFGIQAFKEFPSEYDIPWYIGDSYYYLGKYELAITYYLKALELQPEDDELLSCIADSYLLLENFKEAEKYADLYLELNDMNYVATNVKDQITNRSKPIGEQIKTFIMDNYLYSEEIAIEEEEINKLFDKEDMSNLEISAALKKLKLQNDIFTYTVTGNEYDSFVKDTSDAVDYQLFDDKLYVKLYSFNFTTDSKVLEILDSVEAPERTTLILDLRDNGGGLTQGANNILDALLPSVVTSTLIYRDGETYNYYSDASQIKFHKIYILVNENSASASELLTLGLKTYLNNVTILGRKTFGKGVGQIVYENKKRKLMVCLVNHYWNVRQQNIMNTSITPDIIVESEDLEAYYEIIDGK